MKPVSEYVSNKVRGIGIIMFVIMLTVAFIPIFLQENENELRERNIKILKHHGEVVIVPQGIYKEEYKESTSPACIFKKVSYENKDSVLMYETYWEIFDEQLKALAELTKYYDVILYTK